MLPQLLKLTLKINISDDYTYCRRARDKPMNKINLIFDLFKKKINQNQTLIVQ